MSIQCRKSTDLPPIAEVNYSEIVEVWLWSNQPDRIVWAFNRQGRQMLDAPFAEVAQQLYELPTCATYYLIIPGKSKTVLSRFAFLHAICEENLR